MLRVTGSFHQTVLENGDVKMMFTGRNLRFDPGAGFVLAIGISALSSTRRATACHHCRVKGS